MHPLAFRDDPGGLLAAVKAASEVEDPVQLVGRMAQIFEERQTDVVVRLAMSGGLLSPELAQPAAVPPPAARNARSSP